MNLSFLGGAVKEPLSLHFSMIQFILAVAIVNVYHLTFVGFFLRKRYGAYEF